MATSKLQISGHVEVFTRNNLLQNILPLDGIALLNVYSATACTTTRWMYGVLVVSCLKLYRETRFSLARMNWISCIKYMLSWEHLTREHYGICLGKRDAKVNG